MPRFFNVKTYSFNVKIAMSLFVVALFLITILFALIVPKMQEDEYNRTINEIEKVLSITEEQIKLAGEAIVIQSQLEIKLYKKSIEHDLSKLANKIDEKQIKINEIQNELEKSEFLQECHLFIKDEKNEILYRDVNFSKKYKINKYETWEEHDTSVLDRSYTDHIKLYSYSKKVNNLNFSILCNEENFNPNHFSFEEKIKKYVQNTFNATSELHKGKTYIFWLNSKFVNEDDKALFQEDEEKSKEKYTISKMSNVKNIYTGNLSAKKIFNSSNKGAIEHTLKGKAAISWIRNVYKNQYENYNLLLVKTVYKEDLKKHIDSALLKILPAAFIALILAFIIAFFLFKKLFKTINILTNTAKEVNRGNKKVRSKVRGNDDIGNLGIAFDSMLDSFENSIKTLDIKVEEKTKELKESLEEKETLLKEIHHRVKNNLALTISLIKLQEAKIDDKQTQSILNDVQERIYTMELLHRKLYESTNLHSIPFKEYVSNLINDISKSYNYEKKLDVKINIESINLNIEKAMPCGLILNEIITNSFKYAFIDNEKPSLEVFMQKENEHYELIIKDNGKGLDKSIDINSSSSLGLKLINSICTLQLDGEIKYYYDRGACFKIVF